MSKGDITQYIDVAQVLLYIFWFFFAGLIFYLQRETKREGYPLVYDGKENRTYTNCPPIPEPKTFLLHDGREVAIKIQYPGIREAIQTDLKALGWLSIPMGIRGVAQA